MKPRSLPLPAAAFLLCLAAAGCSRSTGPYPSREIRLIVQSSPGGLSDTVSRVIASRMEIALGVPVVCENRPGATGALAFSYVSRQAADGYIIGHGPVELAMVRTLGFTAVGPEDVDLLALVSMTQAVVAVHTDSPWRGLNDVVSASRARPGHYVVGNSGTGSIWHINALLLERAAKLRWIHCPFSGSSGSLTALLGKHLDAVVAGAGEAIPHVQAGRLRVISVLGRERSKLFPEVPSSGESGFDTGTPAWSGFYAPRGLPAEARNKLHQALDAAFHSEMFQRVCVERGMEPRLLLGDAFREFASAQSAFFASTIPSLLRHE